MTRPDDIPGVVRAEDLPKTRFPDDDGFDVPPELGEGTDAGGTVVSAPVDDEPGES